MTSFAAALFLFFSTVACAAQEAGAPAARLAIIPDDSATEAIADLLIAELSGKPGLQLLERAEVARILREQQLSTAQSKPLALGKLLGADGVLLLTARKDGTNDFLTSRLIAVKPGVIFYESAQPLTNDLPSAKRISAQLTPLLPKLQVLAKDAIPISLVNLRAAVQSPEALTTESNLRSLTVRRLLREPELFVLERERMQDLTAEKELQELQNSPFWNGSYLLEGVIDRDGHRPNTITLHARLMPAKGGQPISIEVSSPRTNLARLVDQFVTEVASSLKLKAGDAPWDPTAEADLYFEEAKWASRWGIYAEALAAAEASWSLGKQTTEVAAKRVDLHRQLAAPKWQDYRVRTAKSSPPDGKQLKLAERALQLCSEGVQTFVASDAKLAKAWYVLSLQVLVTSSDLLRHFYLVPEFQKAHEDDLANVRSLAREFVARLKKQYAYRDFSLSESFAFRVGDETGFQLWSCKFDLREVEILAGAYWQETPGDALEVYRAFARSNELPFVRTALTRRHAIGWTDGDKARVPQLWTNFVQELCVSTNPLLRVEGQYIAYSNSRKDPELEPVMRARLFQLALENVAEFEKHGWAEQLLKDINTVIPNTYSELKVNEPFRDDFRKRIVTGIADAVAADLRSNSIPKIDSRFFQYGVNPAQAAELLELVKACLVERVGKRESIPRKERGEWNHAISSLENLQRHLESRISPVAAAPRRRNLQTVQDAVTLANLLRVDHFWRMPESIARTDAAPPAILQVMPRGDYFWMSVSHRNGVVLMRIDPVTFQHETIPLPPEHRSGAFEVFGNHVYVASAAGVGRYDLARKTWEKIAVSFESNPQGLMLFEAHGRIILATGDTLIELSAEGQSAELLASRRRNPPLNVLDPLPSYRGVILFPGANTDFRAVIGGKLYTHTSESKSWSETLAWPRSPNRSGYYKSGDGIVYQGANRERQSEWWFLPRGSNALELLLSEVPTNSAPPKTWWAIPPHLRLANAPLHFENDTLWMLAGDPIYEWYRSYGGGGLRVTNGSHATLVRFNKNDPQPELTPLWFETSALKIPFDNLSETSRPTPQGFLSMLPLRPSIHLARSGLIVVANRIPGFWLIPLPGSVPLQIEAPNFAAEPPDTALLLAARKGDLHAARDALGRGANVEARNERTWTPLMLAAHGRHREIVKLLIEKGATVNAKSLNERGDFVLSFAAGGGDPEIVKLLLDRGAKINARGGVNNNYATALFHAIARTNLTVTELLLASGADPNDESRSDEMSAPTTMLRVAARYGAAEIIRLLLSKGAAIDKQDEHGETALHSAARHPSPEALKVLLENRCTVNLLNEHGYAPLHNAATLGRMKNVELLLAGGADPTLTAYVGGKRFDPAEMAEMDLFPEVAALIRTFQKQAGTGPAAN